jgi:putative serine protease PepD
VDEEDQGGSGQDPDDGQWDEFDETLRGWIPPDDRLWRHPSESGRTLAEATSGPTDHVIDQGRSTGPWILGGAAACVVVALVAAGLVMVATGTEQSATETTGVARLIGVPTTDPGLRREPRQEAIESMVASIRSSTVALRIRSRRGTSTTTGLVVESGGIVVTPSQSLSGATSITAIEPDGIRGQATLVGIDQTSGLAVLRIVDDLPAAVFDDEDPAVGAFTVAAMLKPGRKAHAVPSSLVYAGRVVSSGQALGADAETTAFSSTAVAAPLGRADLGCPLVDGNGHVIGMLERTEGVGKSAMAVFLPSELVLGVALQLVESGTVDHGWMGVEASDATGPAISKGAVVASASRGDGAQVVAVEGGSPALVAGLEPGDVITAINGYQVHSAAELRSRLYPDPPGTDLAVTYEHDGTSNDISVVLGDNDGDAPEDGSSP